MTETDVLPIKNSMKIKCHKSKGVLISIKPKWVNLILQGTKTVELRKSYPDWKELNGELSFKAYIYCTRANSANEILEIHNKGKTYK